jgi:hypothetical protein
MVCDGRTECDFDAGGVIFTQAVLDKWAWMMELYE